MEELNAVEAARRLGLSREAVDAAAREGRLAAVAGDGPRRFSAQAVEEFHQRRMAQLVATLARSGETPVSVACRVRKGLHASGDTGLPRAFAAKLSAMPSDWRMLFNRAELAAACVKDGEGCRWCKAAEYAEFLGLRPVEFAPARVELFGGPPCGKCGPGLLRPYWAALEARVHGGAVRPSKAAVPPSAAERERAREWVQRHPVTAAARPVQDDGGRGMVARRLREERAKLKSAKRAGDQRSALRLARVVRGLEADAAAVDGRTTAAVKPGRLACGHPLAAGCGCPRRSSARATS